MKKLRWLLVLAGLWCPDAFAQGQNPVAAFLRDALAKYSPDMIAAAAQMPADKYDLKGPPDAMTFGYLILHIADANNVFCSIIGGVSAPELPTASDTDPKDVLVERIKSSFDFCTTALAKLDDSHKSETLSMPDNTKMSRAMAILTLAGSWTTHDAQLKSYLDLVGLPHAAQ
jgi:hypothetical protein